jgi:hypothetical protein
MTWQTGEFGSSHEGTVGALLEDGSEPKPVWIDSGGSGPSGHQTSEWWAYNGHYSTSRASHLRGSCSCGWRGEASYLIDWEAVGNWPHCDYGAVDFSGPRDDWDRHIDEIEARTVPIPKDVEDLLERVDERLAALAADSPLAALRAVAAVGRIVKRSGWDAACGVDPGETPWEEISKALGLTEQAVKSQMRSYMPDSVRNRSWSVSGGRH